MSRYDWRTNRDRMGLLQTYFYLLFTPYKRGHINRDSSEYAYHLGKIRGILLIYRLDGLIEDDYFIPNEILSMRTFKLAWKKLLKEINPNNDFLKKE